MDDISRPQNNKPANQAYPGNDTSTVTTQSYGPHDEGYTGNPETYETADGTPVSLTPQATPLVATAKKPSKARAFALWGAVGVLVASMAAGMFWFWNEAQTAKTEAESAKQQVKTAQDAKTAAEKKLSEATKTTKSTPTTGVAPAPAAAAKTDDDQIKTALTTYLRALKGQEKTAYEVTVMKKIDVFAKATYNGANGAALLKKVDGTWIVIYMNGSNAPAQDVIDRYAIPADLLKA